MTRLLSATDREALRKEAARRLDVPSRRLFLRGAVTLGGLSMLTGCEVGDQSSVDRFLAAVSRFNDRVQGALFSPTRLAQTYPASMITQPFPFNAFYPEAEAPTVDGGTYRLAVSGLVEKKAAWTLDAIGAMPQHDQITRHICVEGWSAIGRWGGVRLGDFLDAVGADRTARYVGFKCADDYFTSIDMATARHPQTIIALTWDGQTLPRKYGYPMKIRMPTKLGYKNPKHVAEIFVTNQHPGGYWENQGYNWFGGS